MNNEKKFLKGIYISIGRYPKLGEFKVFTRHNREDDKLMEVKINIKSITCLIPDAIYELETERFIMTVAVVYPQELKEMDKLSEAAAKEILKIMNKKEKK